MKAEKIKAVMHVAHCQGGFGIRARFTRNSPGVWLGSGASMETLPKGAAWLTRPGEWFWIWKTQEEAQQHLDNVVQENDRIGGEA